MKFIKSVLSNAGQSINAKIKSAETALTRAIVERKVKAQIGELKKYYYSLRDNTNEADEKIQESTGIAGELIDDIFSVWAEGFKGLTNTVLLTVCENEEAIVNLVSNNAPALNQLSKTLKTLNTDINKQSILGLLTSIKEDGQDYLKGEYTDVMDEAGEKSIQPNVKAMGELWGKTKKFTILVDGEDTPCTVEHFNEHRKNTRNFCFTDAMWLCKEITKEEMERVITDPKSRKVTK
jgi:hypothetical protein